MGRCTAGFSRSKEQRIERCSWCCSIFDSGDMRSDCCRRPCLRCRWGTAVRWSKRCWGSCSLRKWHSKACRWSSLCTGHCYLEYSSTCKHIANRSKPLTRGISHSYCRLWTGQEGSRTADWLDLEIEQRRILPTGIWRRPKIGSHRGSCSCLELHSKPTLQDKSCS